MSALIFVRDDRTLPYVPVTTAALDAIREKVPPRRVAYARSLYVALLELANDNRSDRAAVSRKRLGEQSGMSADLVTDLAPLLVAADVVLITERHHGGQRLENEWAVVEPETTEVLTPLAGSQSQPQLKTGYQPQQEVEVEVREVEEHPTSKAEEARAPGEWPDALGSDHSTPDAVLAVLSEVAADHNAPAPTRKALGHVLLAFPDRSQTAEAHELASWFVDKPVRDTVSTYRNWLKKASPAATGQPVGSRNGLHSVKAAPQKLEAKSKDERGKLREWAAENLPDLPESQVLSAATRLQYAGHEVTANRVRAYLEQVSS